ncbi:MAG: 2-C-methyl-D-erythritol 4-phosphate cytidylyltransferase [Actinomycetota bacterium]|nr:2-C-methyl-D-erythritol 4-phosphate cytidylyltransferase [Actinomycetota bacterium]MEC8648598.1 2-C-methyl-D-erythritol 4-phosphate cytidylyltransferase [Actinomycetota bacterium]
MSDDVGYGRVAALVPAAGRGERLGPGAPKAIREIAGTPMLVHAVKALAASPVVDVVVVAAPSDYREDVGSLLQPQEFSAEVFVVAGGESRSESVARALIALPDDVDVVLVHDAARPLVPPEVITNVVAAVRNGHAAVVPVVPLVDTIRTVGGDASLGATVSRDSLRAVQTPQGFTRDVLQRAHAEVDAPVTDDAGMVERLGVAVHAVDGHEDAFKVTRPLDVVLAEALIEHRRTR